MKIRNGFVSNSSSSSFIIYGKRFKYMEIFDEYLKEIENDKIKYIDENFIIGNIIAEEYDSGFIDIEKLEDKIEIPEHIPENLKELIINTKSKLYYELVE